MKIPVLRMFAVLGAARSAGMVVLCASLVATACEGRAPRTPPPAITTPVQAPATPGGDRVADPADWCGGHGLPESMCTKCNPSLLEGFKTSGDWCAGHGFPESVCPSCNPMEPPSARGAVGGAHGAAEHAGDPADWCVGHGLPESKCTKCNPSLVAKYQAAGDWCAGHGFPESVCPACNPQTPPAGAEQAAIEARTVRFSSPEIEEAAGIQTVTARRDRVAPSVDCTARIAFHGDRVADIRAIVPGIVRRVRVELGAQVEAGAPLFELESTRVGEIQAALQTAQVHVRTSRANLARQRELRRHGIIPERKIELARQELATAQGQVAEAEAILRMTGAEQAAPLGRYTLTTPIAGLVVRRPAVLGLLASESSSLATIADTSVMWALCDVPEAEASRIALGQKALVTLDGGEASSFEGRITWIAAEVDPRTRMVTARVEVPNPRGRLRANQFARARIETEALRGAVSVPRAAIQRVGLRDVVFVRTTKGVYHPRVVVRRGGGDIVQVEGNLRDGDAVVTTGAILLRTEIMPGSIGAGCCEVRPRGGE